MKIIFLSQINWHPRFRYHQIKIIYQPCWFKKCQIASKIVNEDWERILLLANTITHTELCELPVKSLLHKLFHEEMVTLFEEDKIEYECQQDREKFEKIIFNLGEKNARDLLKRIR
ncbi:Hsp33 family molecular chaperone HslO [Abyssogena phaseoliformis symbiont]|uniref:Hsp33 family molecular chaperone HslO n=1 Tax=Abyssogena phaseoliformis symbiont TaxID=596095 RepID=UPI002479C580|nr:Hsp33 family molecular chaperone HslO [Abyssogena phaseoliformis symbiont]